MGYYRRNYGTDSGLSVLRAIMEVLLCVVYLVAMTVWTDNSLDWLSSRIMGYTVNCPWYSSIVVTILLSPVIWLCNLCVDAARLIVG